jgi:hypothetical protein
VFQFVGQPSAIKIGQYANMCSVAIGHKKLVLIATHCMTASLFDAFTKPPIANITQS